MASLRIATWNINGLAPNIHELESIITTNKLDVVLISESHATERNSYKIQGFNVYRTAHPDGKAHAGAALVIRSGLKHSLLETYSTPHLQASSIRLEDRVGSITLSAVYCPPRHKITEKMFTNYFETLGHRFIAGGDWNAKHSFWGSRCTVTRGRELKRCLDYCHLQPISTGHPTYWPSDPNKLPDLLDFFVTKGLSHLNTSIESSLDGSSDHTPVILTLCTTAIVQEKAESLHNHKTDWESFRSYLEDKVRLNIALKTRSEVDEGCNYITNLIQVAAWINSPNLDGTSTVAPALPPDIKQKILDKRRLRRTWQQSRHTSDKTAFNQAAKQLKTMLQLLVNSTVKRNLEMMSPTGRNNHSLWRATKIMDKPQQSFPPIRSQSSWARTDTEKAEAFALHLANVFKPNDSQSDESDIDEILNRDFQMCLPIKPTSPREIAKEIRSLDPRKAPGFDLITPKILKELPKKCISFLACLFNAIFRTSHFPAPWKISQITMVHKLGKPAHEPTSYRPISLTPVLSKLWERIFLRRLKPAMDACNVIPTHQFGFRQTHSTTEQVHRVYQTARQSLEQRKYCSAAFLDVQQAFDRVWHRGLLAKIKESLPHSLFPIMASYLADRSFQVKQGDARSTILNSVAGVPQGSVLGPVLYNIFTSDLPTSEDITVATYADDIAYLASDTNPKTASTILQRQLDSTYHWLQKWRIRASAAKSHHITFTLRREDCPPVKLGVDVLPHSNCAKYLGFHLDRRLTWKDHLKHKRDEINMRYKTMYWLMGRNSRLSVDNKLLIYNSILKPIWTYGIQLWGVASKSNILCLQRVQNYILRSIVNAPWYAKNEEIHDYLNMPMIASEIARMKVNHAERLARHPNPLVTELLHSTNLVKRLKRAQVL